ncbi:MAG TPA: TonB family protein [Myxococcaceae bacterium]|nr:TonB family protein [Myxococcaceae bacterium]
MFDSVLGRSLGPAGRPALGAAASLSLHCLALALALAVSTRASAPPPVEIIHFPPLPKGPARPGATEPPVRPEPLRPRKPLALSPAKSLAPRPTSLTPHAEQATAERSGEPGPAEVQPCAAEPCPPAGSPGADVRVLEAHMTPPRLLSGPAPSYPAQAQRERIGGTVSVRCTVSVHGAVEDCQVLRGLPLVEGPILEALRARRYVPALEDGHPVAVRMVFTVRVVPP